MRICDGGRRLARLLCLKLLFIWGRFDKHMARFDRFVGAGIAIMMLLIGAPLLLVGSLFAWQLLTRDGDERTFKEPEGRWRLVLEESCLIGPCYKYAKLIVRDGYVSRQELLCAPPQMDTSKTVLHTIKSVSWSEDGTEVTWTAQDKRNSGSLHIGRDCYAIAAFDDRPKSISLRFRENCLRGQCFRSVLWVVSAGGFTYTTPCTVAAHGNKPVFTLPKDVRGQVAVKISEGRGRATWESNTGQSGEIIFVEDCDSSQTVKEAQPA